jgi:hypothetical protein
MSNHLTNGINPDNVSSIETPILNSRYILVETTASPNNIASSSNRYLKNNFSELIYTIIQQSINEILTLNQIIKTSTVYQSNIFFLKQPTESVISNTLLSKNPTYQLTANYVSQPHITSPSHSVFFSLSSNEIKSIIYTKDMLSADRIVTPQLANHMYTKTKEIVETLNHHLYKYNIQIQTASLEFYFMMGSKNIPIFDTITPELIMEHIVLKPTVNVFDNFTFVERTPSVSSNLSAITDSIRIYKALTGKPNVDIETYKPASQIIQQFKQKYRI